LSSSYTNTLAKFVLFSILASGGFFHCSEKNSHTLAHVYAGLKYMFACICDIVLLGIITSFIQDTNNMVSELNSNTLAHVYAGLEYVCMYL